MSNNTRLQAKHLVGLDGTEVKYIECIDGRNLFELASQQRKGENKETRTASDFIAGIHDLLLTLEDLTLESLIQISRGTRGIFENPSGNPDPLAPHTTGTLQERADLIKTINMKHP